MVPLRARVVLGVAATLFLGSQAKAAESTEPSNIRVSFQGGVVGGLGPENAGPMGVMDLVWTPWSVGGVWWEVGVLDPTVPDSRSVSANSGLNVPTDGWGSSQNLEASTGFLITGSDAGSVAPYLRAGLGAYHVEAHPSIYWPSYATNPPHTQWSFGGSIAAGATIGSPTMHVGPLVEAACHFRESPDTNPSTLLTLSAGVWFR